MVTNICENAIGELERGNSTNLGKLMNENQTILEQIGVSNKGISSSDCLIKIGISVQPPIIPSTPSILSFEMISR